MSLRTQIADVYDLAFSSDYLGQEVEYNSVAVQAIFTPMVDPQNTKGGTSATALLQVLIADLPSWSIGDLVSVDGETWKVKREGPGSNHAKHVLHLERDRRMKP